MRDTWRSRAVNVIWAVINDHRGADERTIRLALRRAYPFGERRYWPYKVWCEEVDRALRRLFPPEARVQGALFDGLAQARSE